MHDFLFSEILSSYFYTMQLFIKDFKIQPSYFDHKSLLHDAMHTYRVMIHVLLLGKKLKLDRERRLAFFAAFIHDMARKHDGFCAKHGYDAAMSKPAIFSELFKKYELEWEDIEAVKTAVICHSMIEEPDQSHPHYIISALLKDADALDRIRMGAGNLKIKYLRFHESITLIPFAENLFRMSNQKSNGDFDKLILVAERFLNENISYL
jgi:hypothetical protein